uniref:NADH-ubiquinone oxidoreductase chain 1 n=1 Tax=Colobopsis nipponica TaxID=2681982 RepID=A0A7S6XY51_9HYME|nr:NADH dehydrogenase subunit 1 [Colobopsis nipponica]QOW83442.1 NADH dehydrogenase subunit 1 [Colobopsis nipponica]
MNYMFMYVMLNLINMVFLIMILLVGIAFLTLLERKVLGYIQGRKGPNKVGVMGIIQPFSDAVKLLNKELFIVFKSNYNLYFMSPLMMIMLLLSMWMLFPFITNLYFLNYSFLLMIVFMSIMSYVVIFMGWSSNSIYSMIGAIRSISQMLSYEVSFIMIILILMIMSESYSFMDFVMFQNYFWYMCYLYPLLISFFISMLAELNRSPMDFIEGESELVSGFNVEYFSGGFTLIFMSEYGMIIYFSMIMLIMFTNLLMNYMFMFFWLNLICFIIIVMRGLLPRMRYDELMYLCWKIILPMVLMYMCFIMGMKFFLSLLL